MNRTLIKFLETSAAYFVLDDTHVADVLSMANAEFAGRRIGTDFQERRRMARPPVGMHRYLADDDRAWSARANA